MRPEPTTSLIPNRSRNRRAKWKWADFKLHHHPGQSFLDIHKDTIIT